MDPMSEGPSSKSGEMKAHSQSGGLSYAMLDLILYQLTVMLNHLNSLDSLVELSIKGLPE